ncbi:hypothetical protein MPSEU_000767600 [Mayamaea pseudoterrestris]|nr:hypothetical protein MPSEU_000767600 [Mayamaea pseudoterrestris]
MLLLQSIRIDSFISAIILLVCVIQGVRAFSKRSAASVASSSLLKTRYYFARTSLQMSFAAASSSPVITNPERVQHVDKQYLPSNMKAERTKILVESVPQQQQEACVCYWMQRDVRVQDNWALCLAAHLASQRNLPLKVLYALTPPPPLAASNSTTTPPLVHLPWTKRHADFALGGLECVHRKLAKHNVPLHVVMAPSQNTVGATVFQQCCHAASVVVCDFTPIRQYREWLELQLAPLLKAQGIPLWQVDAHNIVPVWTAAPSRQVGARTLRPKIHNVYKQYMADFPVELKEQLAPCQASIKELPAFERAQYEKYLQLDESVAPVAWAVPGTKAAGVQLQTFIDKGLPQFDKLRNDPTLPNVCSNLSPWINHGQVSFQRVAHVIQTLNKHGNGTASFIEEGVVRRELSDNFLYYTPHHYDSLCGAAEWAQTSLREHASDTRNPCYTLYQLEHAHTYDDLWNAAQLQLTREGRMHGFLRMYWAKKILEWTADGPAVALQYAQHLNDKYALDGRDPNGFVGVGWSIMGIHDMGWKERPIFGKIRYMNYAGCKRKFKVAAFVAKYKGAAENAAKAGGTVAATGPPAKKQKTLDMFKTQK